MTTARLVMTVAVLMAAVGCTAGGETAPRDGEAASSCAGVVTFEDRRCLPSDEAGFTVGGRLGTATVPACDDTPGDDEVAVPEATTTAYGVEGRDPADAIAVGDTAAGARLMEMR